MIEIMDPVDDVKASIVPHVLALTILDTGSDPAGTITQDTKIRVCVRNRSVNRTHAEIVSVPTQRIPVAIAEDIFATSATVVGRFGDTRLTPGTLVSNKLVSGHHSVIYAVEALLSGKLGVGAELEAGLISFSASLSGVQEGFAIYSELNAREYLKMLNVIVKITEGSKLFPENTVSYSAARWVPISGYMEMWLTRDVTRVGISARDAIRGICVDGLCISSTYDVLAARLGGLPEVRRSAA